MSAPLAISSHVTIYHLLGYHAAHANADDMGRSFPNPANVVEQLESVFGHFGRRVPHDRLVAFAHTAIVKDEARVLGSPVMTKVYGLSLPEPFEGAKTDDPLASVLSLCHTSTSLLAGQSILQSFGGDLPLDGWAQFHEFHIRYQKDLL